jgi:queuine/archaeosine tRNA-ribosyltransferase
MIALGFPKEVTMVADTGIFEVEARKAGISRNLGIDVDISLTNSQITEAYELSGADMFVAPDEIILVTDEKTRIREKTARMKDNLHDILDIAKPERVIAVIQGQDRRTMTELFDFYRSNGIIHFAMGGLIPLWRHDKNLFRRVVHEAREMTRGFWLHTFGLPIISLLPFYLQEVGMDSVDTSTLLYMTARRKYLIGLNPRPVRLADFSKCDCPGCQVLNPGLNPRGHDFFIHLYIHNVHEAVSSIQNAAQYHEESDTASSIEASRFTPKYPPKDIESQSYPSNLGDGWKTALDELSSHSSIA